MTLAIRARIDRYPAKMVGRLADRLLERYAEKCTRLLDPFCGSGEILVRARAKDIPVVGYDINPYATLLARVRLEGFDYQVASRLLDSFLVASAHSSRAKLVNWENKDYWFTARTLEKYEVMRACASRMDLNMTREGRSVLLAYAFSIRMCSRADERSPKPFISKIALEQKAGRHIDPLRLILTIHVELCRLYGKPNKTASRVVTCDIVDRPSAMTRNGTYSHVMTSPPYLNAQDYFRNFKLELFFLEGLIDFEIDDISQRFIGTERGALLERLDLIDIEQNRVFMPQLQKLEKVRPKHAEIAHRYLFDMRRAFLHIREQLKNNGVLVLVCGDNLIGSFQIKTWRVLNCMLESMGFIKFDSFKDVIKARALAPKRSWHKSLMKEERITAFRLVF